MPEDLFLEVKGMVPYDLTTPSGRFQLAKDVSAFANAEGGHLLIGFIHEKLPTQRIDQIKELQLFASTDQPPLRAFPAWAPATGAGAVLR
jgi:hypothetical protein